VVVVSARTQKTVVVLVGLVVLLISLDFFKRRAVADKGYILYESRESFLEHKKNTPLRLPAK